MATEHLRVNEQHWDDAAPDWVAAGERHWAGEPSWGIWDSQETELNLLPADMSGLDAIELGCGTGYVSAWMARRGASVVGIDLSSGQLATAQRLAAEHQMELTLLHGNAESVPRPDGSFDFAISEYGAVLWCDPYRWVPEAHRLLRPGGTLVTMCSSSLLQTCRPADDSLPITDHLAGDYFGLHRQDWTSDPDDPGGIEFGLPISGWFRLFDDTGFDVLDFIEVQAPADTEGERFGVPASWARRYPSEQVWKVRKRP